MALSTLATRTGGFVVSELSAVETSRFFVDGHVCTALVREKLGSGFRIGRISGEEYQ